MKKRMKPGENSQGVACLIIVLAIFCVINSPAQEVAVSMDETSKINGIWVADQEIGRYFVSPGGWALDFTAMSSKIPGNVAIDALDYGSEGCFYFSLDCDTRLGGVLFADEDVILWDGTSFALLFDGDLEGLPGWAGLDALDVVMTDPLEIILSLDIDALLTVGGETLILADEDLVRFKAGEGFTDIPFDGSHHGVPGSSDLDAFSRFSSNSWILSFGCAGRIGSLDYDDGDLVEWNPSASSFCDNLFFDGAKSGVPLYCNLNAVEADRWDLLTGAAKLWMIY